MGAQSAIAIGILIISLAIVSLNTVSATGEDVSYLKGLVPSLEISGQSLHIIVSDHAAYGSDAIAKKNDGSQMIFKKKVPVNPPIMAIPPLPGVASHNSH